MRAAVITVMLSAATTAHAGDCADTGLVPTVLTPANAAIDDAGGVAVGLITSPSARAIPELGKLAWQFHENKLREPPRITTLAPGLAVFTPKHGERALDLEDDHQKVLVRVAFEHPDYDDMPIDAAPSVTRATYASTSGRRSSTQTTTLDLAAPAPANIVAIIASTTAGKPKSWARLAPGATSVVIWSAQTCRGEAPGTERSGAGSQIVLVFVNSRGHTSLPSNPITVK
jgi:hypothetical protein